MKHVATDRVRNMISVKATMEFGSYTMLFPPRRLMRRIIIVVIAEPMDVARPSENIMNLILSVMSGLPFIRIFVFIVYRICGFWLLMLAFVGCFIASIIAYTMVMRPVAIRRVAAGS